MKALLIDDEPPARNVLRALLAAHPTIEIAGEAGTLRTARELLAHADYALVFLDIQLRGGNGFDLVPLVRRGAAVVFVTAHDEHALRAFEVNALDYLLKPIKPERLATSLARVGAAGRAAGAAGAAPAGERLKPDDTVYLKTDDGARFLPVAAIAALSSCENYCEVHLTSGERILVRQTMKAWEDRLPAPPFARVHRQLIVNFAVLTRVEDDGGDAPLLHLSGLRAPVRASRREWAEARALLPRGNVALFRPGA